jgi:HSP90 family molecular chaperone
MLFVFTLTICLSLVFSQEVSVDDSEKVKTCFESNTKETKECADFFASVTQTLNENTKNIGFNSDAYKDSLCCAYHEWEICALEAVKKTTGCEKSVKEYFNQLNHLLEANVCPKFQINPVNCK